MPSDLTVKTVNGFPYWCQLDYKSIDSSISKGGCGPTSAAMVLYALGKTSVTPKTLAYEGKSAGYWNGMVLTPQLFQFYSKKYDVSHDTLNTIDECIAMAKKGYPVLLDGRYTASNNWSENCMKSCYSSSGHYVVLVAVHGDQYVINDPRGIKYSGLRPKEHLSRGFKYGVKLGDQKFNIDPSKFKQLGTEDGVEDGSNVSSSETGGSGIGGTIEITFNDTTSVQESLPNANVSDNWVDMHKIKGITLHMYPPYHNCTADSMAKYFEALGWDRNFHYKVDKNTKIDFSKKPVSGQTTGGNQVGSSVSDYEVTPKDPLYSGVVIGGGGSIDTNSNASVGETIDGNDIPSKIYNYCVSQGCSAAAACGIVGNAECESSFNPKCVNSIGASGLFQWLGGRLSSLKNKARSAGKDWTDVDVQIQHMWAEFTGEEKTTVALLKKKYGGIEQFKKMSSPETAAKAFGACFERAGDNGSKRAAAARKWYDKLVSSTPSTASVMLTALDADNSSEPFGWPVPSQNYVQSYYGYRKDSLGYNYHPGIDIVNYAGNGAYCYAGGKVKKVLDDSKLSSYVRIDHGNGIQTIYGSLGNVFVKEGDTVVGGECIGTTSSTVSNPLMHLHFEMLINGEHVDPLDYVEPGGGNKQVPQEYYGISPTDISDTDENITWDNIDKGKICFASADNNTHTYIDANMFNNQHPKYTLSIGAFFYDEFDLVEKTGKVNYPATEKKIIEQCAKALYDEGFTSKQLWREFDLNRAPSPFLYLDRDKWEEFCKQVDLQVDWLNKKYGKVKATYVPNNLLTDQNNNQFIETAPDGGIQGGGATNNTTQEGSFKDGLWIGDSFIKAMQSEKLLDSSISVVAKEGVAAKYYLDNYKLIETAKKNKEPDYIAILLGVNNPTDIDSQKKLLEKLRKTFKDIPIFVFKVLPVAAKYASADHTNKKIKVYNEKISEISESINNCSFKTESTTDLVTSDGVLKKDKTTDGLHLTDDGYSTLYNNMTSAIKAATTKTVSGNGLFIGDDWDQGAASLVTGNTTPSTFSLYNSASVSHTSEGVSSKDASYFYKPTKNIDRLKGMDKSVSFVYIHLGYNRLKENLGNNDTILFLNRVKELWPNTAVYVAKLTHCGRRYSGLDYNNAESFNEAVDKYNEKVEAYCKKNSFNFIDISSGLVDSDGYLKDVIVNSDNITLKDYSTYYSNLQQIIGFKSSSPAPATYAADDNNEGKYCYVGNTSGATMYKVARETAGTVATLAAGDELTIVDTNKTFYKCKFGSKTGYVKAEDVVVLASGHGDINKGAVNQNCWIKYENTDFYKNDKLKSKHKDLNEQDQAVVLDIDANKGLYKIKTSKSTGYIKAYAITFEYNYFKVAIDQTTNKDLVGPTNTDIDNNLDSIELKNNSFEMDITDWSKEGALDFTHIENPEWGTEGHWPYRGKGYARIKNIDNKIAGIRQEFKVDKKANYYLRILFYVKQTTQKDFNDGPVNPDTLKANGIYVKLLDGNKKVKHEKKISLTGISNIAWSRVGCLVSALDLTKYTLFIGSNTKFDLCIDDIVIEKVLIDDIDKIIGDSNTSSGITLSGVGTTAIDNGGVMVYEVGKPTNKSASQPEIKTVITQKEYEEIMEYAVASKIDLYTNSFEPYDKDLIDAKMVGLTDDVRFETLTEEMKTFTDNMIRYKVVETGPGSIDHCVKPVDELNVLYKNVECNVDPIYPDLVIPPKYTTSTYDSVSKNSIPLTTIENATASLEDTLDKSYSYDYSLLNKKTKKSTGKPTNYYDPYPYDDKITDLENHYPKVLIDEIESRIYSCNHPGCPIAHPMAKNFAMLSDMSIRQSKATEQRLVRLENTLATMVRYVGRMGSRLNVNCVYYGGQTVLGKYKCVRCLRDNRVDDGATVTIDQCLNCTRYEPIIGQMYDILDETGFNGSAILDDMQMSYMTLNDFENLNRVEKRSTEYSYINTNKKVSNKPVSLIDEWLKQDKDAYVKELKKKYSGKKLKEKLKDLQPSDYLFMMDWTEQSVDLQKPDVKVYPTEKIAAKYYNQHGDPGEKDTAPADESVQMGTEDDVYDAIAAGEWVDTRETDDSIQLNKYTSLDFYFENFNLNRTGYEYDNGLKGNIGLTYSGGVGTSVNGNGAEIRNKIVEYAYKVAEECKNAKATYCNNPRTVDPNNVQYYPGTRNGCNKPACYDCTSLVSSAYKYAGLSCLYAKSASGGTLVGEVMKGNGKIWLADKAGFERALPGDVIMVANSKIGKFDPKNPPSTHHAMIYTATNEVTHASGNYGPGKAIRTQKITPDSSDYYYGKIFFVRPKELMDADAAASATSGVSEVAGTIDGVKYIMALKGSKCTQYKEGEGGYSDALGNKLHSAKCNTVASHNLPYGTKVYIPYFKGKQTANPSCIFTVTDTGNAGFDFDICCPASVYYDTKRMDVYVTEWGSGKGISMSHTKAYKTVPVYAAAWKDYVKNGGTTYKVTKFQNDDANITSQDFWTKYL